jgi:sigma-E factor negative regulatory protein RseC
MSFPEAIKIIEQGVVVERKDKKVKVLLKPGIQCGACHRCEKGKEGNYYIFAQDSLGSKKGQRVEIQILTTSQLKASLLLYGLPLIVFILVNIIVYSILKNLNFSQGLTAMIGFSSSILFMIASYYIIFLWCKKRFKAEVVRILK